MRCRRLVSATLLVLLGFKNLKVDEEQLKFDNCDKDIHPVLIWDSWVHLRVLVASRLPRTLLADAQSYREHQPSEVSLGGSAEGHGQSPALS